ncbi:MAG TPA: tripartite tricarboxylate transporter substrate binding protein [Burkholderiales bacterium]|nr:tripartite tricarboxylate transporter substrate binding protein [Burkholderiales bacterium]
MRSLRLLVHAAAAGLTISGAALAAYPDHPIRMIVPYAPGSSPDNICRALGQELGRAMNTSIVIDNRGGASGSIGSQAIAQSAPDGYTIGYGNIGTLTTNRFMIAHMLYDPDRDFTMIVMLGAVQNMLAVNNNLPAHSVKELIALAKAKPGKLVMASGGAGNTGHLGGELFKSMTGTYMLHVPYKGSAAAITDLIGGQADLMFDNLSSVGSFVKSGKLRGLGVSGSRRSPSFPDTPTIAETVPGYETLAWGGVVAPAGLPPDIAARLNAEVNKALKTEVLKTAYFNMGFEPTGGTPAEFTTYVHSEMPKWQAVIKRSGAKME